jgi:hypothetical protein
MSIRYLVDGEWTNDNTYGAPPLTVGEIEILKRTAKEYNDNLEVRVTYDGAVVGVYYEYDAHLLARYTHRALLTSFEELGQAVRMACEDILNEVVA